MDNTYEQGQRNVFFNQGKRTTVDYLIIIETIDGRENYWDTIEKQIDNSMSCYTPTAGSISVEPRFYKHPPHNDTSFLQTVI